jgi:hypothetical protein
MRYITVYRSRAQAETLFLHLNKDGLGLKMLGSDHRAHILSFLVEGGRSRYLTQLKHANRLMDYINERDATLLRALVDPRIRRRDNLCFETFLKEYANGEAVIRTIKCMLLERYFRDAPPLTAIPNKKRAGDSTESNNSGPRKLAATEEFNVLEVVLNLLLVILLASLTLTIRSLEVAEPAPQMLGRAENPIWSKDNPVRSIFGNFIVVLFFFWFMECGDNFDMVRLQGTVDGAHVGYL